MVVIITLVVGLIAFGAWRFYTTRDRYDGWIFASGALLFIVLIVWGALTIANLSCRSLGESYQEDIRFDWLTGCMLPLDDDREIQIDEDSIALVIRDLVQEDDS